MMWRGNVSLEFVVGMVAYKVAVKSMPSAVKSMYGVLSGSAAGGCHFGSVMLKCVLELRFCFICRRYIVRILWNC